MSPLAPQPTDIMARPQPAQFMPAPAIPSTATVLSYILSFFYHTSCVFVFPAFALTRCLQGLAAMADPCSENPTWLEASLPVWFGSWVVLCVAGLVAEVLMDTATLYLFASRRGGWSSWLLTLCTFLCLSSLMSVPITGAFAVAQLIFANSWLSTKSALVVYACWTLRLTSIGFVAEVSTALLRLQGNDQRFGTRQEATKGTNIKIY